MAEIIRMPLMSDTMIEGVIAEWHKEIGEDVESGDLLAEIETDKATMEFEAPEDGVLLYRAEIGQPIPINNILAILGEEGEDISEILEKEKAKEQEEAEEQEENNPVVEEDDNDFDEDDEKIITKEVSEEEEYEEETEGNTTNTSSNSRLKASPLAKRLAAENSIDLQKVTGTGGTEGRIIKRDIETYLTQKEKELPAPRKTTKSSTPPKPKTESELPTYISQESYKEVRVSQMRKTIARRLSESKFNAPHFYLRMSIKMDKMVAIRRQINEFAEDKISFNDWIIKAAAMALRQHPTINASWLEDKIRYNHHIHIGVAMALDEGLVVPVVKFTDNKSLSQLRTEIRLLANKARSKKLTTADMQGNTFTISNLGMFDIDEFTAIINPPDSCILAVGKIKQVPVVQDNKVKTAHQMNITLSCDHRVVDGATGARFLQTFKSLLEDPVRLLI